jgi:hypothetical protein
MRTTKRRIRRHTVAEITLQTGIIRASWFGIGSGLLLRHFAVLVCPHANSPDIDLRCSSLHPQAQAPDDPLHDRDSQYARVIRSILHLSAAKFQGFPRIITSISFYFNSCLKATSIYYPAAAPI